MKPFNDHHDWEGYALSESIPQTLYQASFYSARRSDPRVVVGSELTVSSFELLPVPYVALGLHGLIVPVFVRY